MEDERRKRSEESTTKYPAQLLNIIENEISFIFKSTMQKSIVTCQTY